ncbi:hypothetical_protein [Candidozyma auris]|uniref:hypothetical_protein n=1 Tax=Candidozyma auris TaxID=498019 RepID=UPI00125BD9DE|nr:hypothetical_protein [[Candida] auris]QEO23208.1 hypothetical_protein [[Candida] auris]
MSDFSLPNTDFSPPQASISKNMQNKGYSQTFSSTVLRELDMRAQQISGHLDPSPVHKHRARAKRYSNVHKPMFQKMESISCHYAASRQIQRTSPAKEAAAAVSSATKKRRTLNGPEEVFGDLEKENESPLRRKGERIDETGPESVVLGHNMPSLAPPSDIPSNESSRGPFSGSPELRPTELSSPERTAQKESPSRFSRISPSKGHMNLNSLLHEQPKDTRMDVEDVDNSEVFAKPLPKQRQTSLQMAGVTGPRPLHKKPSVPSLQKRPSSSNLQSRPSSSSLHKKPSASNLKQSSAPSTLHKKPSVPRLQSKSSIPNLRQSDSSIPPMLQHKSSHSSFQKPMAPPSKPPASNSSHPQKPQGRNFTIPQPFSLYDRPTISSSQKSLSRSPSRTSLNSMSSDVSQRSLSKFQRFKSRFS